MKYIIVTQTYPPRIGGMQNVMIAISKKLACLEDTHVFPDHFLSKKYRDINSQLHIHNNFSPKLFRPFIKKYLVDKVYKDNDVIICDSWKSSDKGLLVSVPAQGSVEEITKRIESVLV